MKKYTSEDINELYNTLEEMYPNAHCELNYTTPFELLVAVILSAQCTDKRVNEVTKSLFLKCNTAKDFDRISQAELERLIYTCGFYVNKAKNIKAAAKKILNDYNGEVPQTVEELMTLPGVGKKTANVVFSEAFKGQAIAVDTHVLRVSNRLRLAKSKEPLEVEKSLQKYFPKSTWSRLHHLLIFHGRYRCKATKPDCSDCKIKKYCEEFKK